MVHLAKAGALGALGAAGGIAVLFLAFVFFTIPTGSAGMDWANATVSWIIAAGVALVLIAVHLVFARQLLSEAKRR